MQHCVALAALALGKEQGLVVFLHDGDRAGRAADLLIHHGVVEQRRADAVCERIDAQHHVGRAGLLAAIEHQQLVRAVGVEIIEHAVAGIRGAVFGDRRLHGVGVGVEGCRRRRHSRQRERKHQRQNQTQNAFFHALFLH